MMVRADSPHYKWLLILVLFFAASLNYADRVALMAVFPLLRKDLLMSDMELAAVGSLFLWSYSLASPLAGFLGDRFSRSGLVTYSLAAWSLITILTGWISSSQQLLAMRVLLGITESLYIPASLALIAEHHDARSRATAMSIHLSGFSIGVVFGGTLAGYLGDHYGWRSSLLVLGSAGLPLAALCKFLFRGRSRASDEPGRTPRTLPRLSFAAILSRLFKTPSYWVLLVEAMLLAIGTWTLANWLPLYLSETFKMSLKGAGFAGTFPTQAGAMAGVLVGGYLSDRVARKSARHRMLLHSLCYLAGAPLLLAFVVSSSYWFILTAVFGYALLRAIGGSNANPLLCDLLPKNCWSTGIGLMNTSNTFVGGIGILLAGYVKSDFGLSGVFASISVMVVSAGVLLLVGYAVILRRDLERSLEFRDA